MNYIILDLEWDSAYFVKEKRFINQILQIGAVKLDSEFNIVSTFEQTIRSAISKRVSGRFSSLTGITNDIMRSGIPFDTAVDMYNEWAGTNTVTMTWSDSDLYSIKENEDSLLNDGRKFNIEKYLDLQKFVQGELRLNGYNDKNQISLSAAAEVLGVTVDGLSLHTAKDDSLLSVAILKRTYNEERFTPLIRNTADPEFYKRLRFKPYNITSINDSNIDPKELIFDCPLCGNRAEKTSQWKYRNRWFSARFTCKSCKKPLIARISFKKTYDDIKVRKKIKLVEPKQKKVADEVQNVSQTV